MRAGRPFLVDGGRSEDASSGSERGLPIAWLLPIVLGGLVLCAVLPVMLLGFYGARDNTGRLLRDRDELILDIIVERITAHLDPVRVQVAFVAEAIRVGKLDAKDEESLRIALVSALAATPQTTGIALVRPDLRITRYNRLDYRVYDNVDVAHFPGGRDNLGAVRTASVPSWNGPVWSELLDQSILQFRAPLTGPKGEFQGVLVAAVSISDLSRYLGEIEDDLGQTPFVLAGRDRVLAHPLLASSKALVRNGSVDPLPNIGTFPDRFLAGIWSHSPNSLGGFARLRRSQGHWSWLADGSYETRTYIYRMILGYGEPWTVGFHYPGTETRRARWIVVGIGIGGVAMLLVALSVAVLMGRHIGRPWRHLAKAAARVEALDFYTVRQLPRGPVREINLAIASVERMARGLTWFQTYVPRTLVQRLMAIGPDAQPSDSRDVTVMFTDLERYTAFSTHRSASEVVDYLNALLCRIGPIIEISGGTIDKFIGDSVMAFWGAPEDNPDHAGAACRAASLIAQEVEAFNTERRQSGQHACRMRIGLHTGPVSVGNVGFSGRWDYTIVGQTVNLAQRLEQACREVIDNGEVVVLVSDETASQAGPLFPFTPCLGVTVSGVAAVLMLGAHCRDGRLGL